MGIPDVLAWRDGYIEALDQTVLPHRVRTLRIETMDQLIDAIKSLAIRGAPLLGAAGTLGVALSVSQGQREGWDCARLTAEIDRLASARPTAVNLAREVRAAAAVLDGLRRPDEPAPDEPAPDGPAPETPAPDRPASCGAVMTVKAGEMARAALRAADEVSQRISLRGAAYLRDACGTSPLNIHTHCNTGSLACLGWGTALGVIRALHADGAVANVIVDETRPLLQGARLTCWELDQLGIEHRLACDGAGPFLISRGLADAVVVGADRIAANADVANKIGTYSLALAAHRAGIPFVVAAPESTIDENTPDGAAIPIEQRPDAEVAEPAAPDNTRALNYAFDVTPAELVTAIVTEERLILVGGIGRADLRRR